MIRILIVEDEETIREGIMETVPWKENGLSITGAAADGQEALGLIRNGDEPDIIVTDIRMPHMGGLEFIEAAKVLLPAAEFIVISGYDDFAYARKALQMGVRDYLIKPCRPLDLLAVVLEAKAKIEERRQSESAWNRMMKAWELNRQTVMETSLLRWMHHPGQAVEEREGNLREWNYPVMPDGIFAGIVRFDESPEAAAYRNGAELIRYAALNIMQETLRPVYRQRALIMRDGDDFVWIANTVKGGDNPEGLRSGLVRLQMNLEKYLHLSVSIGVGCPISSINGLHLSYNQAVKAVESRYYKGKGSIVLFTELEPDDEPPVQADVLDDKLLLELEQEILHSLRTMQFAEALDQTELWLGQLAERPHWNPEAISLRTTAFLLELQKLARDQQLTAFEWKHQVVDWLRQIPLMETLEDLSTLVKTLIRSLVAGLTTNKPTHRTVQGALELIHAKYHMNLTLDYVAKEMFVSTAYLSSLFKQELGVNFLDYLHQYRTEQAKSLLKKDYKVYAVAKMAGYQDERRFSSTFKKWTGLTPSQFKKSAQP